MLPSIGHDPKQGIAGSRQLVWNAAVFEVVAVVFVGKSAREDMKQPAVRSSDDQACWSVADDVGNV